MGWPCVVGDQHQLSHVLCFQKGKVSAPNVVNILISLVLEHSDMYTEDVCLCVFIEVVSNCTEGGDVTAVCLKT